MGSIDTTIDTASSKASPTDVIAEIVDDSEPNDDDDLGDTSDEELPDEETPSYV